MAHFDISPAYWEVLKYLTVFTLWYFAYGTFAYRLVFERTRPWTPLMPFQALCEDLALQLPGRKAEFIRKQVDGALDHGHSGIYLGGDDWTYENIRKNNLYAKVGSAMLPGPVYVLFVTAPLLYPVWFSAWNSIRSAF